MAIISFRDATLSTGLLAGRSSGIGLTSYEFRGASPLTGSSQSMAMGPPRYNLKLVLPDMTPARAGQWRALLMRLRGGVNVLESYDPARHFAVGGARGDRTLGAAAGIGAVSVSVTGGGALVAGDWLQIGTGLGSSQLVMCVADVTLPAAVQVEPPLYRAFPAGALVRIDRASTYFRAAGRIAEFIGEGGSDGRVQGLTVDFVEALS